MNSDHHRAAMQRVSAQTDGVGVGIKWLFTVVAKPTGNLGLSILYLWLPFTKPW
jgi:hypothetical protein